MILVDNVSTVSGYKCITKNNIYKHNVTTICICTLVCKSNVVCSSSKENKRSHNEGSITVLDTRNRELRKKEIERERERGKRKEEIMEEER